MLMAEFAILVESSGNDVFETRWDIGINTSEREQETA